jgi:hypothetical protein
MICADFKTIKSFVKWSQNDQILSDRIFWILSHVWSFYFVLNSCTRKRHSTVIENIIKNVMMIDDDNQRMMWHVLFFFQSDNVFIFFDFIIRFSCFRRIFMSCLSWSSFFVCLVEIIVRHVRELFIVKKIHTFLRMFYFLLSIVLHQCFFREIDVVIVACLSFVEMSKLQQLVRRKKIFWYFNDQFDNV